jgi:uncharacterized Tic20 family protein
VKGAAVSSEDRVENVMPAEDRIENVPPTVHEEAVSSAQKSETTSDERTWGMLCHLSALIATTVSLMGFIGPLICWLVKKDTSKFIDDQGKEALNFQINMLIYFVIATGITVVTCGFGGIVFVPLGLYAYIMPIIAGIKAYGGEMYRYPLTFRML